MNVDADEIKNLMFSLKELSSFLAFLSPQEVDRFADVLKAGFANVDDADNKLIGNYKLWSVKVKGDIVKELDSAQIYFGLRDLTARFPLDIFLQNFYSSISKPKV